MYDNFNIIMSEFRDRLDDETRRRIQGEEQSKRSALFLQKEREAKIQLPRYTDRLKEIEERNGRLMVALKNVVEPTGLLSLIKDCSAAAIGQLSDSSTFAPTIASTMPKEVKEDSLSEWLERYVQLFSLDISQRRKRLLPRVLIYSTAELYYTQKVCDVPYRYVRQDLWNGEQGHTTGGPVFSDNTTYGVNIAISQPWAGRIDQDPNETYFYLYEGSEGSNIAQTERYDDDFYESRFGSIVNSCSEYKGHGNGKIISINGVTYSFGRGLHIRHIAPNVRALYSERFNPRDVHVYKERILVAYDRMVRTHNAALAARR